MAAMAQAMGSCRWHHAVDGIDPAGAGRAKTRRAAVLADGAAALLGLPVPIPHGRDLSAGAARIAGAAAENGPADARRLVSPDAGLRTARAPGRRIVAAL